MRRQIANKQIEQLTDVDDELGEWQQVKDLLNDEIQLVTTELNQKVTKLVSGWEALTGEKYFTTDFPF